jgi:hypothetical protein
MLSTEGFRNIETKKSYEENKNQDPIYGDASNKRRLNLHIREDKKYNYKEGIPIDRIANGAYHYIGEKAQKCLYGSFQLPFLRMRASKYCLTSRICPTDTILW